MIGFARRAGKLVTGHDAVCRALENGSIQRVYLASDLSEKTAESVRRVCERLERTAVDSPYTMEEADQYIHKRVGVIGVTDRSMDRQLLVLSRSSECTETEE